MDFPDWVTALPRVNASLNGLATVLLILGLVLIRRDNRRAHKRAMLSALAASILFLACYLLYHFALWHYTNEGSKAFTGQGAVRLVYYTILISHVVLAATVPVLASITIYRGLKAERERDDNLVREKWDRHKRIAKITFPIWVYVSVTGVIIYGVLYHWPAG